MIKDTFVSENKQLLKCSSNALCEADPIPASFVKEYQAVIIGPTAKTISISLSSGVSTFHESFSGKESNTKGQFVDETRSNESQIS